jgi:SAM-dependent methyltransferase
MRARYAIWRDTRVLGKGSARTIEALRRLARRAFGRRRPAGWYVARTAFRHRSEATGLAALALLAAWGTVEAVGSLETLLLLACLGLSLAALRSHQLASRYRAGAVSESAVAKRLRSLEPAGWIVLDDLDKPGRGNVDHFAAGPGGAFTIETKTVRYTGGDILQAFDHARWAERRLGFPVTPILCLARRHDPPYKEQGVVVCGATELASFLDRQPGPPADTKPVLRRLG